MDEFGKHFPGEEGDLFFEEICEDVWNETLNPSRALRYNKHFNVHYAWAEKDFVNLDIYGDNVEFNGVIHIDNLVWNLSFTSGNCNGFTLHYIEVDHDTSEDL